MGGIGARVLSEDVPRSQIRVSEQSDDAAQLANPVALDWAIWLFLADLGRNELD